MSQTRPARSRVESTVLDHRLDLTRLDRTVLLWGGVVGLALLTRLVGLTNRPLSSSEAALASDGLALVTGGALSAVGQAQPLPVLASALAQFLLGPSDGAVRLVPLVAGLLTLGLVARTASRASAGIGLATALLVALSPTFTASATQLDGGALLLATAVATLAAATRYEEQPGGHRAALLGVAFACLPLAHPLGWLVAGALALWGAGRWGQLALRQILPLAGAALATVLLASTALLSRPGGTFAFLDTSLSALVTDYLGHPLRDWPLVPALLVTDEFPATIFALTALAVTVRWRTPGRATSPDLLRHAATWTGVALLLAITLGGKGTALYATVALPLSVLGGIGLRAVAAAIDRRAMRDPWDLGAAGAATALLLATLSLTGRLLGGPNGQAVAWLAGLLGLLAVALALGALTHWLWRRASRPQTLLLALPIVLLLALGLRTSLLLHATNTDRPGELLVAGTTSPGVRLLVDRITRLSGDVTTFQADVRDPTGGHGLTILLDEAVAQPFQWYFRAFPNLAVSALGDAVTPAPAPDVVIAPAELQPALAARYPDMVFRVYPLRAGMPEALARPDWGEILTAPVDPWTIDRFLDYLIDRQVTDPPAPELFVLGLRPDLAERLYGPASP